MFQTASSSSTTASGNKGTWASTSASGCQETPSSSSASGKGTAESRRTTAADDASSASSTKECLSQVMDASNDLSQVMQPNVQQGLAPVRRRPVGNQICPDWIPTIRKSENSSSLASPHTFK